MKSIYTRVGLILLFGILSFVSNPVTAQVADSLTLPEIRISANRFDIVDTKLSTMIQRIDVIALADASFITTGDILSRNSRYVVRTYGPGQAQTAGSIGFNASQVKVIWNGIELNHPMLGLVDLSLFPAILIDEISVDNHLGSSEYGSSSIGGTVLMESGFNSDKRTSAEVAIGSFNARQVSAISRGSIQNWSYSVGLTRIKQENDFEFSSATNNSLFRENADKQQITGLMSARFTKGNYWGDASLWFSSGETGAPGSISFPSMEARQKDRSFRAVHRSNWIHSDAVQSQFTTTINRIGLDYKDPAWNTNSVSDVEVTSINYALRLKPTSGYQFRVRSGYDNAKLKSTDFTIDNASRLYLQANGLITLSEAINIYPSIRFDSYSEFDNAFSYGIGVNYEILSDRLFMLGNINKNYAPPTFNDLYWPSFGNPDLQPETALKSDIGLRYLQNRTSLGISYFISSIENGILWWADASGSFSPNNVNEIRSYGFTSIVESTIPLSAYTAHLKGSWTWLDARYDMRGSDGSLQGNQVVYSPKHRVIGEIGLDYRSYGIAMVYEFTSELPANDFNSVVLDPVHFINLTAFNTLKFGETSTILTMTVKNVLDSTYQLIYDYPMPGRTWNIGMRISL